MSLAMMEDINFLEYLASIVVKCFVYDLEENTIHLKSQLEVPGTFQHTI